VTVFTVTSFIQVVTLSSVECRQLYQHVWWMGTTLQCDW